jgi:TonB-linked SusC/RagA family outer membrane protein
VYRARSLRYYPIAPAYDDQGNIVVRPFDGEMNPLLDEDLKNYNNLINRNRFSTSGYLELTPINGLVIRSTFAGTLTNETNGRYFSKLSIDGKNANDNANKSESNNKFISWENTANYSKTIGDHSFNATLITSWLKNVSNGTSASGRGLVLPAQLWYNLGAAGENVSKGSSYSEYALSSYAARLNYSYRGKYIATFTGRYDGSSKLGGDWAFFPSAAFAWRIIDENFMKNQRVFSELKLRAAYGVAGNDAVNPYATQNSLTSLSNFSWNGTAAAPSYTLNTTMGNKDLRWEPTRTIDVGIDASLLRDRLLLTIDYYNTQTSQLLFNFNMPASSGFNTVSRNFGKTKNNGIEITLESRNFAKPDFSWNTTLTWALNREKIVSLPDGKDIIAPDYRNSKMIGYPSNVFVSYYNDGIWQLDESTEAAKFGAIPGDLKIRDIAEPFGVIDAQDRAVIGTTQPDFSGGLNNDLRWKNLDLNFYITFRVGQWITSDYWAKYNRNGKNNNVRVSYWTPENPGGIYPRPNATRALNNEYLSMLSLRENSYAKLRNVTLGYTLPQRISQKIYLERLRVWVSGRNLLILSKEPTAFDPENEGVIDQPLNKLVTFGLNVTF